MVSASLPRKGMWISQFNIMTITRSAAIVTFFNVINDLHSLSTSQNDYEMVSQRSSTRICSFIDQYMVWLVSTIALHLVPSIALNLWVCGAQFLEAPCVLVGEVSRINGLRVGFPLRNEGGRGKICPSSRRVISPTDKFQILNTKFICKSIIA